MLFDLVQSLCVLAAVIFPSTAHPSSLSLDHLRRHYRVHQQEGGLKRSGPEALLVLHRKYNILPSPELLNAATLAARSIAKNSPQVADAVSAPAQSPSSSYSTKKSSGTVSSFNEPHDRAYLTPFTVGSQIMMLDIDTGSADFWVFSTLMPASQQGTGHTLYDPTLSPTAHVASGFNFSVDYGDSSRASGIVYTDQAGVTTSIAPVTQAVELATDISPVFTAASADGIVGFGFDKEGNTCKPHYCRSFLTNVAPSLPTPLFGVALSHDAPGHFDFGFIDTARFTGALVYAPIDPSRGFWQFQAAGFAVGSQGAMQPTGFQAVADTGTSIVLVAAAIAAAYWAQVPSAAYNAEQGGYLYACSTPATQLPAFCLFVGTERLCMPGEYALYRTVDAGMCYGAIQESKAEYSIIGDSFLKSMYVVFDLGGMQVGFAQQVGVEV